MGFLGGGGGNPLSGIGNFFGNMAQNMGQGQGGGQNQGSYVDTNYGPAGYDTNPLVSSAAAVQGTPFPDMQNQMRAQNTQQPTDILGQVTQALLNQPQQQPPQQTAQNVGPGGWPMPNELRPADVNRADKGDYLGTPRSSDPNAPAQPDAYPQIQTGGLPLGQVPSVPLPPPRPPAPPAPAPSLPPAPQPPPPPQRAPLPPNAFQGVAGPPQGSNEIVGQPQSPYNQPNSMQALQNFLFGNMRGLSSLAHQRPVGYNYGSPTAALIRPPAGYRHPAPKKPQSRSGSGKKKSEKDRERHRRDEQRDEDRQSGGR